MSLVTFLLSYFESIPVIVILVVVVAAFNFYMKYELWRRKLIYPLFDFFGHLFRSQKISEREIQKIETNGNTIKVMVLVNHLNYELDDDLKYDVVMKDNINRGVTYYYMLPRSLEEKWEELRKHLMEKGVSQENLESKLKVRFLSKTLTSFFIYGVAIYIGKGSYSYRRKQQRIVAVQYSKIYEHSYLVDTSNAADDEGQAIMQLKDILLKNESKFKFR